MMSQDGHNVHNVTPRLLIIVEKAQFIDIVRWLCNLGLMFNIIHTLVKIFMLSIQFFASHITRSSSKYDVRLNNTVQNSIHINNGRNE